MKKFPWNQWKLISHHANAPGWCVVSIDDNSVLLKHEGGNTVRYHLS